MQQLGMTRHDGVDGVDGVGGGVSGLENHHGPVLA